MHRKWIKSHFFVFEALGKSGVESVPCWFVTAYRVDLQSSDLTFGRGWGLLSGLARYQQFEPDFCTHQSIYGRTTLLYCLAKDRDKTDHRLGECNIPRHPPLYAVTRAQLTIEEGSSRSYLVLVHFTFGQARLGLHWSLAKTEWGVAFVHYF